MKAFNLLFSVLFIFLISIAASAMAQDTQPYYLQDRGVGIPSSMFGTYIGHHELITYLYFEYYLDNNMEYKPAELGYGLEQDFRGKYRAAEGLIFIGYGLTEWLAVELEAAIITATLRKSPDDPSSVPDKIEESGLGDVESQLRWRWLKENSRRPEIFSYFEIVFPLQKDKVLIGTQEWELKLGTGITKGFHVGTFALRAAIEYATEESKVELGEYAVEYVKRLSPHWRAYLGVEGSQDEVELITEAQWHIITDTVVVKLNNAFGITSKATDWAPEVGIMLYW
jgi:hypothetical protein